ncbi:hypothetical protein J3458_005800 [Metarhizium acridum]|uniref:uncharacterized protein n=1 Tax=Metarhizium acridum TaxID=92637 RepID=UPI001C6D1126|nr:hypothetical protein J3458_005800 [Metarhizium acridum]
MFSHGKASYMSTSLLPLLYDNDNSGVSSATHRVVSQGNHQFPNQDRLPPIDPISGDAVSGVVALVMKRLVPSGGVVTRTAGRTWWAKRQQKMPAMIDGRRQEGQVTLLRLGRSQELERRQSRR